MGGLFILYAKSALEDWDVRRRNTELLGDISPHHRSLPGLAHPIGEGDGSGGLAICESADGTVGEANNRAIKTRVTAMAIKPTANCGKVTALNG